MRIIKRTSTDIEINLVGVLQLFLKRLWIMLLCAAMLGALSFTLAKQLITPEYTAQVTLYVNNSASSDASTSITTSDLTASAKLVDTYAAIISSNAVLTEVAAELDSGITAGQLRQMVSISAVNDTEVFQILVVDTDAARSADIANVVADVLPEKISEIVEGSSMKVIDYATVPTQISAPNYSRYGQLGALAGFVGVALIVLIREILDTRIRGEDDLRSWDIPILGAIPELSSAGRNDGYGYQKKRTKRK